MSGVKRLYELLPAIYRIRDAEQGQPLRALLAVIERELREIEEDIAGLYDDLFIETCAEWVVPYIGDLLRVRGVSATKPGGQRAYVANTLRYRRRKGTASVLEQLARDTTGWPARVVEFFQRLITTQHMNHIRDNLATPNLRHTSALELLGGPFEQAQHMLDVREIASGRGRYNIPNIGLFVWRLRSYPVARGSARAADGPPAGRFRFSPAGVDAPLFNQPRSEPSIAHLAEEHNVPGPLRRRALYDDLEAYRAALAEPGASANSVYFAAPAVLTVFFDGQQLQPEELVICNLSEWDSPGWAAPASRELGRADGTSYRTQVAVDPALGRAALMSGIADLPDRIGVSYAYGFSADVGGGPYDRSAAVAAAFENLGRPITWQAAVGPLEPVGAESIFPTLAEAVAAWNAQPPGTVGVIAVADSATYVENLSGANVLEVPEASWLMIVAAEWPTAPVPDSPGLEQRIVGQIRPIDLCSGIRGDISLRGTGIENPGAVVLNGLLLAGELRCLAGNLGSLRIEHCTIVPGAGGLRITTANESLSIGVEASICGPINLPASVPHLEISGSIVSSDAESAAGEQAIAAADTAVTIRQTTVFGTVQARSLEAENTIFTGRVDAERTQVGCARFSFVPAGSRTPRRYRCQPDLALDGLNEEQQRLILASLRPAFTSLRYGQPGYAQLGPTCPAEIRTGAEDGSEMGVFSHLLQPQREAHLRVALEEYLPFGLAAGIIFVT
jgi:hypothetical protein